MQLSAHEYIIAHTVENRLVQVVHFPPYIYCMYKNDVPYFYWGQKQTKNKILGLFVGMCPSIRRKKGKEPLHEGNLPLATVYRS